jgi:thiol-disulfide isomerase/thioredoxin
MVECHTMQRAALSLLMRLTVLVATTLCISGVSAAPGDERSLFRSASEVVDIVDLKLQGVHRSAGLCPWVLIAYSDGCGHCRSAAPSIVQRAKETFVASEDVAHEITIAALNCQVNAQVCNDLDVQGVPSFFFLAPGSLSALGATLSPITLSSPTVAGDNHDNNAEAAAAHTLHRFDIGRGGGIDAHLDHARRIWSAMANGTWSPRSRERCLDMRSFLRNSKQSELTALEAEAAGDAAPTFMEEQAFHSVDVANAFFFTLYHEVALVGLKSAERRYALNRFLRAVQHRLPGLGADVLLHEMADRANSDGQPANPSDFAAFSVADWQHLVLSAGIPFQGTPRDLAWVTCRGSSWRYRGFPCGLWLLYHALSANAESSDPALAAAAAAATTTFGNDAADTNGAAAVAGGVPQASTEILFVIKDYVRNFFSCETCRQHFMHFDPNREEDPAWQLWKVHNVVNYHLAKVTEGADPLVPKRQFPGREMCPLCYRDVDGVTMNPTSSVVATEMIKFLRQRYRWVPSTLRKAASTTFNPPATAAAAAGAGGNAREEGDKVILVRKTPLSVNIFLTMVVVVVLVLLAMQYVLRRAKTSKARKHRTILPLRTQS